MTPQEKARHLRPFVVKAAKSLDDKDISECVEFCDEMKYDGSLITYQTRINWHGTVKMARQDLWDREENNPDNAPALWADIKYKDGIRVIVYPISAEEAFSFGEQGWWEDVLYESIIPGERSNVYTPEQYPAGWKLV